MPSSGPVQKNLIVLCFLHGSYTFCDAKIPYFKEKMSNSLYDFK